MYTPDQPLAFIPPELSDETAAQLLDLLYDLTTAFENCYTAQILRYHHQCEDDTDCCATPDESNEDF